jgi:iron(III) transport system ATP-binding protein
MIAASRLEKVFGEGRQRTAILRNVSFAAESGTIFTLLGPSGSGKTTSLRCVAGLEVPDSGEIMFGATCVFSSARRINLAPNKRRIGMVFQSYAIWPHMTVAENVAFPLENRGLARRAIGARVDRVLTLVGLDNLGGRDAPNLSGGQQQRVALARAIVDDPEVLLLDEPLSNLDAKLRWQMRQELVALQKRLGLTILYVTHDQEEALALSHRIALMREGEIVEAGNPLELFERPTHRFTAEFLGLANFLACAPSHAAALGRVAAVDTAFGRFAALVCASDRDEPELFFRPHRIALAPEGTGDETNVGRGTVSAIVCLGEINDVTVRQGDQAIRLRLHGSERPPLGTPIVFRLEPDAAILFLPP